MQITPRVFAPFNPRSLAGGEKQRRGGRPNPGERGSPAARLGMEELKGSKPHPLVLVARWETVGEGGSAEEGGRWWRETRRRGHSGGIWSTRSGWLATRGRGGAGVGVGASGAAVEAWFDGGLELAGIQVDGGGVLGSGDMETAKEPFDSFVVRFWPS